MTKKHYEAIAAAFLQVKPTWEDNKMEMIQWKRDIAAIAAVLEKDNPRFDCCRFFAACGWENHREHV